MNESFENKLLGIAKLRELEQTGNYLFHGSPNGSIEILEPRQSTHTEETGEIINDGDPAISATPYLDLAIFRGIINEKNIRFPHESTFGFTRNLHSGVLLFGVSEEKVLEEAKDNKTGFVYVFNKSDFQPYSRSNIADEKSMEWRSYSVVQPIKVIEVHSEDLPPKEQIKINTQQT